MTGCDENAAGEVSRPPDDDRGRDAATDGNELLSGAFSGIFGPLGTSGPMQTRRGFRGRILPPAGWAAAAGHPDPQVAIDACHDAGVVAVEALDLAAARHHLGTALERARRSGRPVGVIRRTLARVELLTGDLEVADQHLASLPTDPISRAQVLVLRSELGLGRREAPAVVRGTLGLAARALLRVDEVAAHRQRQASVVVDGWVAAAAALGHAVEAERFTARAQERMASGPPERMADGLLGQARLARLSGRLDGAASLLDAASVATGGDRRLLVCEVALEQARTELDRGDGIRAVQLWRWVEHTYRAAGCGLRADLVAAERLAGPPRLTRAEPFETWADGVDPVSVLPSWR